MTPTDLDELERLAREATPGPWRYFVYDEVWGVSRVERPRRSICQCRYGANDVENARFIAASREAIPALCAEVRRLRERLDDAERRAEMARETRATQFYYTPKPDPR